MFGSKKREAEARGQAILDSFRPDQREAYHVDVLVEAHALSEFLDMSPAEILDGGTAVHAAIASHVVKVAGVEHPTGDQTREALEFAYATMQELGIPTE